MKGINIITRIQVYPIGWMNFDSKKNGGKKVVLAKPKHQYRVSQREECVCGANHEKNIDYYENPSLFHTMDKL